MGALRDRDKFTKGRDDASFPDPAIPDRRYLRPADRDIHGPNGQPKYFVASDHIESPLYCTFTPDDLFDIVVPQNLHFDQTRQTGIVFHMMSALGECGRVGLTAVGDSHDEAKSIYERAVAVLDEEARNASNW